jgi:hypothetical protein
MELSFKGGEEPVEYLRNSPRYWWNWFGRWMDNSKPFKYILEGALFDNLFIFA